MNDFELTIVGSNSSVPAYGRHQSCQFLKINNQHILLDCGDGSQNWLIEMKLKWLKISTILITHLHGDHFFGLPGLLSTMGLSGRTEPIRIIGPSGLKKMLVSIYKIVESKLNYEIIFDEIYADNPINIFDFDAYQVESVPLDHGVQAFGYIIREKEKELNLNPIAIERYDLNVEQIKSAKKGDSILSVDGEVIPQDELTFPPKPPRSFAYITDTSYSPKIIEQLHKVDLLYHEATFASEMESYAKLRGHSTAKQAGLIAAQAQVKQLIIGHFSSRYASLEQHLMEAKKEFTNTFLAEEGKVFYVMH